MEKNLKLIKVFLMFFIYFLYSNYALNIGNWIGINNDVLIMFISDFLFLIFIVLIYYKELKEDIINIKKEYSVFKILKTVIFWVVVLFLLSIIMGIITDALVPNFDSDSNTNALYSISTGYMIFKTLIFGVIAEELLFRQAIRDVVENKLIFIIMSAIIYTVMHFVFTGFPETHLLIYICIYLCPALFLSTAYIKNNSNILILMLIKFTYNLIPLAILLLGL